MLAKSAAMLRSNSGTDATRANAKYRAWVHAATRDVTDTMRRVGALSIEACTIQHTGPMTDASDRQSPGPSAAQLRALIDQASDGIFVADSEGRYTFANEAGCRMLGFSCDEIIGKTIVDLIPPEDVERLLHSKAQMLLGHTHIDEWRLRRKDGSWIPVEVSAKILPDGQWEAIVRDISERLAQRERLQAVLGELEDERRWLQTVINELPMGVALTRFDGHATYNKHFEALFGMKLSPSGGNAQYADRVFFANGTPVPRDALLSTRVKRDEGVIVGEEYIVERPDGTRTHVLGSGAPVRDESGRMIGAVGLLQDVSERMRAQQAIREERRLLKEIFDILPVGVWLADRNGRITLSNRAGDEIWRGTRYVGPEQSGEYKSWWVETGKPLNADEWAITRAVRHGQTSRGELLRIQCFDGSFKTIINWATPIRSDSGEITGAVAVNEDVTSLQDTQEQLRAAVREREHILAVVAHDLRNPLTSITLTAKAIQMGLSNLPSSEPVWPMIRALLEVARRMSGLVDDLLAISVSERRGSMLSLAATNAVSLLHRAAEGARHLLSVRSLTVGFSVADDLPALIVDADRIVRVLANLLDNALKFTAHGGHILLAADAVAGGVRFSVSNSGEELPTEQLSAMFRPFWQAALDDRQGAGLGLAICQAIVEAHGGTIWAEPSQGQRVRVCFVLPHADNAELMPLQR
jgi:PAS domain S-box-containing protein